MSEDSQIIWYVLRAENSRLSPTPFAKDDFFGLPQSGKLTAKDLVKVPGSSVWQEAGTVKGLFREHNDFRFATVEEQLNKGDRESLLEAFVVLSEVIQDHSSSQNDERLAYWLRGECQQHMARQQAALSQVIALLESARHDFSKAVETDPVWYSKWMMAKHWFPEHPMYLPAYIDLLERFAPDARGVMRNRVASALGTMGREASSAVHALESVSTRTDWGNAEMDSRTESQLRHKFQWAIKLMSQPLAPHDSEALQVLRFQVQSALQIYPSEADRFEDDDGFTDEELARNERELVALLEASDWKVRAKAACILRCKIEHPETETIQSLLRHLGRSERRGNVRGHCALGLAKFTTNGAVTGEMLNQLMSALTERLLEDSAYPVQAIAAKALAQITPDTVELVRLLISVFSRTNVNCNLQQSLVEALGLCGVAAREDLPLVLRFTPHYNEGIKGELIKATAILQIAHPEHPEAQKSLDSIVNALRSNIPHREYIRVRALDAIVHVPMNETLRRKLLLERMYLDSVASIRCNAAEVVINIDKDLAIQAGAYQIIDRIGHR